MALVLTYDNLPPDCKCFVVAYLSPSCLSRFRTVNAAYRRALHITLVNLLGRGGTRALRAIVQIAEKGNADAVTAVSARLGDAYEDVRRAALDALAQIAERGHAGAIAAVSA